MADTTRGGSGSWPGTATTPTPAGENSPADQAFPGGDTTPAAATQGFPGDTSPAAPAATPVIHSAPAHLLLPSLVLGVAAMAVCAYLDFGSHTATDQAYKTFSVIAWFMAGILGVGLVGVYFIADTRRRAESFYSFIGWKTALYWVTCAVITGGVIWSAIDIAHWVGKL
ncbi:hypothetical protein C1Y63_10715 [Corynebacterium sp. 13CS0277]|nr:hypothetical protein C1Y63_10715 [Corynebacterium sp. 13CS0277]